MAKVNMQAWYKANESALVDLKTDFTNAVTEDEDFFKYSESDRAVYKHSLLHRGVLGISIEPVDDLLEQLERINFIAPDRPEDLISDLERYKEHVFDDSRLDGLESRLKSIYGGFELPSAFALQGKSFTDSVQEAFYDFNYERDLEDFKSKVDVIAAAWAAEGYEIGPGAMGEAIADEANAFDRKRSSDTNPVFAQLADIGQKNIQWAIENGTKIEDLHMDFAIQYSELSKVFIQSKVDAYVAEIEKRLVEQQAQISIIDALTRTQGLDVKADIQKNTLELKERTARLQAYTQAQNTYIDTEAGAIIEELKLAANIAEGFGGIFASYGSLFTGISYEE